MRLRDTQRSRVYAVDLDLGWLSDGPPLSLDACEALAVKALERYGITGGIDMADGRGRRRGVTQNGGQRIVLPVWARQPYYVLHEAAHAVIDRSRRFGTPAVAHHGPEYARVYLDLLRTFTNFHNTQLTTLFRTHRVKVARGSDITPKPLPSSNSKRLREIERELAEEGDKINAARHRIAVLESEQRRLRQPVAA